MKYIVYLTVNNKSKIDGKNRIYIGVHQTENPNIFDGYIGCGVYVNKPSSYMYPKTAFQYAVKKYGTDAFVRYILYIYDSRDEAYNKEAEIVNKDFVKLSHVYNISLGGIYNYQCRKIYQFDLNGKLLKEWNSIIDASDFYGYSISRFKSALRWKCVFLNCFWSCNINENFGNFAKKTKNNITYLYDKNGKMISEFSTMTECAKYINYSSADVCRAIRDQRLIKNQFYVSYKLVDEFKPKPRLQFIHCDFYVYTENEFVGKYHGKEIMPIINMYSWDNMYNIFYHNKQWFKNFYISLNELTEFPKKKVGNGFIIDVYTKYGNFIETIKSAKEVREKYHVPSSVLKNIQYGNKYYKDYIFKYSK